MIVLENPKTPFPVDEEYAHVISLLARTGILVPLPASECQGVIGIDGKAYAAPTLDQVRELVTRNKELVFKKVQQGFDRLELVPLAMPTEALIEKAKFAIVEHAAARNIYRSRPSPSGPLIHVRVNDEKQVWIWEELRKALDRHELIYFPQEYSNNHLGQDKLEAVNNPRVCGVPGWSVSLTESMPIAPQRGQGKTLAGRKQLELGSSPRDYLRMLQDAAYQGETGKTLEDFLVEFLTRLEQTGEVSNDVDDNNALWCLGQYVKVPYADLVPTGRWFREVGRLRLDMHRTGNKLCTGSWGVTTAVRLGN